MVYDFHFAEWIRRYAEEARIGVKDEIPRFLAHRRISRLVHFTSIENLESLAKFGFLGRQSLRASGLKYVMSDQSRNEPIIDGICFSISKPNHYMVNTKIANGHQMVLLELHDPESVLSGFNFIASPGNFGTSALKAKLREKPEEFVGGQGLLNLYKNQEMRRKYSIPDDEPTDPQSEIVILDPLPFSFVKKILAPGSRGYASQDEVRSFIPKLPQDIVFQSQDPSLFPKIDWNDKTVSNEFNDRRWNEKWT